MGEGHYFRLVSKRLGIENGGGSIWRFESSECKVLSMAPRTTQGSCSEKFLGNPFKVKPHGPYERNESVFVIYGRWLWREMQNRDGKVFKELLRLKRIAETRPLNLACWCAPEACHGEVVKKAIEFLSRTQAA